MIDCHNPASIPPPFARYSHGVSVPGNPRWVMTSGQLGLNIDGSVPQGARAQTELCFQHIEAILDDAGASAHHVIKINAFVTSREHMSGYMEARDAWLAKIDHQPASTLLIVTGFTRPEFLVEVEAIAVIQ